MDRWQKAQMMAELFTEAMADLKGYEAKHKIKIPQKEYSFMLCELVNSCISRGVSYKDNPFPKLILSLPYTTGKNLAALKEAWRQENSRVSLNKGG